MAKETTELTGTTQPTSTTTFTGDTNNYDEHPFTHIGEIFDMSYDEIGLTYDLDFISTRGSHQVLCLSESQIKEIWLYYQKERSSQRLFQHIMSKR